MKQIWLNEEKIVLFLKFGEMESATTGIHFGGRGRERT